MITSDTARQGLRDTPVLLMLIVSSSLVGIRWVVIDKPTY
jgi:hypothetical protein